MYTLFFFLPPPPSSFPHSISLSPSFPSHPFLLLFLLSLTPAHHSKTVKGRHLQPLLTLTKNNFSGVLFSFDCSKTFFIYSCFIPHTKPGNQQKALELKTCPILSIRQTSTSLTAQANSPCSPATTSSTWSKRRPEAQTDMAPILDLGEEREGGKRGEHKLPRQLAWKNQVSPLQIWKLELRQASVSVKVTQAASKGRARIQTQKQLTSEC